MATKCSDIINWIKSKKKLLFFLILFYMMLLLFFYQGHTKLRELFNHPRTRVSIFGHQGALQETIRYVFHGTNDSVPVIDVHLEHPTLGHTADLSNQTSHSRWHEIKQNTIAIGGGLTSKKLNNVNPANIPTKFQLFTTLLPSFCKTISKGYEYHFYFAYDHNDKFFNNAKMLEAFQKHFLEHSARLCVELDPRPQVHFVQCSHTASPALAQNDAMMEAYLDGINYFYRINDDSLLGSAGWVEAFLDTLSKYEPPNIGVVGPKHRGGNVAILTYDFVHRTHVEIFGFYYPRVFTTWWADDWVTKVYQPGRSTKLASVKMQHTMKLGQRYKVDFSVGKSVAKQINHDKEILQRYLKSRTVDHSTPDGGKVISMSLFGINPRYTMGAIRNAQLMPVYFPDWSLRVYTSAAATESHRVPSRILSTLESLGVHLIYVNISHADLDPFLWRYLVADDDKVQRFLVRDADSRFSDREADAVKDWEKSGESFHCMRDHPSHKEINEGLWGAQSYDLRKTLGSDMGGFLVEKRGNASEYLQAIWRGMRDQSLCHDAVSCDVLPHAKAFPTARGEGRFVGQKFNQHQQPVDDSWKKVSKATINNCLGINVPWPDDKGGAPYDKDDKITGTSKSLGSVEPRQSETSKTNSSPPTNSAQVSRNNSSRSDVSRSNSTNSQSSKIKTDSLQKKMLL